MEVYSFAELLKWKKNQLLRKDKKTSIELDHLKNIKRQEIIDAISEARAHGDLKENAEYHAAREEQGLNEARIRELEEALSTSQVIEYKDLAVTDRIIFGSTVTIVDLETDKKNTYQIVGESEANIEEKYDFIDYSNCKILAEKRSRRCC